MVDVIDRVEGVQDTTARGVLARQITQQAISGVSARVSFDCDPLWDEMTDLAEFDRELKQGGVNKVWIEVCYTPKTWLRLQMGAAEIRWGSVDAENWLWEPLHTDSSIQRMQTMVRFLRSGDRALPKPLIELDAEGHLTSFQEGRHRGVAAHYAGVREMPVYVFLDPGNDRGKDGVDPPSEFRISAILEADKPPEIEGMEGVNG